MLIIMRLTPLKRPMRSRGAISDISVTYVLFQPMALMPRTNAITPASRMFQATREKVMNRRPAMSMITAIILDLFLLNILSERFTQKSLPATEPASRTARSISDQMIGKPLNLMYTTKYVSRDCCPQDRNATGRLTSRSRRLRHVEKNSRTYPFPEPLLPSGLTSRAMPIARPPEIRAMSMRASLREKCRATSGRARAASAAPRGTPDCFIPIVRA